MNRVLRLGLGALTGAAVLAVPARAHDGPPYPILVDEALAGHVVSIWADPDVGVGTFYFYVDAESDRPARDVRLDIGVEPVDEHAPESFFSAERAEEDEPFQLIGEVDFDRMGEWDVRFVLEGAQGSEELRLPVDVTPPGLGTFDIVWYLSPFAAIAFLWIKILLKRREIAREHNPC